jgi:hypothetical protein
MTRLLQMVAAFLLAAAATPAFATPLPIPEPVSLSLLAVGVGGVAAVRALRNRRK